MSIPTLTWVDGTSGGADFGFLEQLLWDADDGHVVSDASGFDAGLGPDRRRQ